MTVGSLFSGIGGFDLGFERAGFDIKWQVEIDDYASAVLAKHWPGVKRYRDVRETHAQMAHAERNGCGRSDGHYADGMVCQDGEEESRKSEIRGTAFTSGNGGVNDRSGLESTCADCLEPVDVICGGFPCQPHSLAGARGGAADERDLWPEFARVIREVRPRWVVAENVPGLLSSDVGRFFGKVLRDLAAIGYDAEWYCISAADVGAPHLRERIWIVAYPASADGETWRGDTSRDSAGIRTRQANQSSCSGCAVADDDSQGLSLARYAGTPSPRNGRIFTGASLDGNCRWAVEPNVGRVAHGVSARVDRLRGLGNSIVPQIAEWIAERIKTAELGKGGLNGTSIRS